MTFIPNTCTRSNLTVISMMLIYPKIRLKYMGNSLLMGTASRKQIGCTKKRILQNSLYPFKLMGTLSLTMNLELSAQTTIKEPYCVLSVCWHSGRSRFTAKTATPTQFHLIKKLNLEVWLVVTSIQGVKKVILV